MLKIGDFSKLSRVSIRMLRHYDDIGLLKPAETDGHPADTLFDPLVQAQLTEHVLISGRLLSLSESVPHLVDGDQNLYSLYMAVFSYPVISYKFRVVVTPETSNLSYERHIRFYSRHKVRLSAGHVSFQMENY